MLTQEDYWMIRERHEGFLSSRHCASAWGAPDGVEAVAPCGECAPFTLNRDCPAMYRTCCDGQHRTMDRCYIGPRGRRPDKRGNCGRFASAPNRTALFERADGK